jgi:predicted transposase YbfD/YdcC
MLEKKRGIRYPCSLLIFSLFLCECAKMFSQRSKAIWISENWDSLCSFWNNASINKISRKTSPSQACLSRFLSSSDEESLNEIVCKMQREKFNINWILYQNFVQEGLLSMKFRNTIRDKRKLSHISRRELPHFSLDGKARKGVISSLTGRTEINLTLYCSDTHQILAKETLPDKIGESVAAEKMIRDNSPKLPVGVYTADAGITSPRVTRALKECGQHYILAIKGNSGHIYNKIKNFNWSSISTTYVQLGEGHGRKEIRKLKKLSIVQLGTDDFKKYSGVHVVYCLETNIYHSKDDKVTIETRYFIGDEKVYKMTLPQVANYIRCHWMQESYHWVKDVVLQEDNSHQKNSNGSRILSILKTQVYTIGIKLFGSVKRFTDTFISNPKKFIGN